MNPTEEVIDAVLEADGTLRLMSPPQVAPGLVRVTISSVAVSPFRRGLADILRQIAAEQRARGYSGRSAEELRAEAEDQAADDKERDRELAAARRSAAPGEP